MILLRELWQNSGSVIGTDTVYDLKEDGTGTKDDAGLTFECGFDEDNNITIKITMDGEDEA